MRILFAAILAAVLAVVPAAAQTVPALPPVAAATAKPAPVLAAGDSALELPPDQTVEADEGFVTITATTKGQVRWLVVSLAGAGKVKYLPVEVTNSVVVSVPPSPGAVIAVYAIASVDGKLTEFAKTTITVKGSPPGPVPPGPGPVFPGPLPPGPAPKGPFHVTFVVDLNKTTPAIAQLLNSASLRQAITKGGAFFRLYDAASPILAKKKIDAVYNKVAAPAMLLVQDGTGKVLSATQVPVSEKDILDAIDKAAGGSK